MESKHKVTPGEAIVWNMVLPGVSQLLNGYYSTAILLLILDFLIYMKSHFNETIVWSLIGDISQAIENGDTSWLSFYTCIYFFAMYDAYMNAGGGISEEKSQASNIESRNQCPRRQSYYLSLETGIPLVLL